MNDLLNQQLSQFIDNELDAKESLAFKKELLRNPDLQARLKRYQLISQAIKSTSTIEINAGFSDQIKAQLAQEPIHFLPQQKIATKPYKQLAIAASLMAIAITSVYSVTYLQRQFQDVTAIQVAQNPVNDKNHNASSTFEYPLNKQINDYLQAHNDGLKESPDAIYQPYTRLSSYNQR